jgi:hypothetical protein
MLRKLQNNWLDSSFAHRQNQNALRVPAFARASVRSDGAAWLDGRAEV